MKQAIPLAATLALLAGCLSAPEQAMVDQCVAGGDDPKVCECVRSESKAHMSAKAYKLTLLTGEKRDAEAEAIFNSMSENEQIAMVNAMFATILKCAAQAPDV